MYLFQQPSQFANQRIKDQEGKKRDYRANEELANVCIHDIVSTLEINFLNLQ